MLTELMSKEDISARKPDRHYLEAELVDLLRRSDTLELLDQTILDGLWYWDLENPDHEYMSPTFWKTLGFDPAEKTHHASEWRDLIFPEDGELAAALARKHLANAEYPFDQVVRYHRKDGRPVTIRCRGKAILRDGKPVRMLGAHVVVSEHKETMVDHMVARLMNLTHDAIVSWTEETGIETWNKGAEDMFGLRKADALGKKPFRSTRIISHIDWSDIRRVVSQGEDWTGEITHTRHDGQQIPTTARISSLTMEDGRMLYLAILRDDTERQTFIRQRELLLHELKHRVKNLFAVVQAMIGIASRSATDVATLADDLRARLVSLAAAHTVSFQVDADSPIALETMIRGVLSPYDGDEQRIWMGGDPVVLNSSAITPMGLIVHEFATNAVKHGALREGVGRVEISWKILEETAVDRQVRLEWREVDTTFTCASCGRDLDTSSGFGTILVENSAKQLDGSLEQTFNGTEFCNILTFRLPRLKTQNG